MLQPETGPRDGGRADRRVRRSRRAIVAAFDRLITDVPLEQITVSAIAREADVDRKTFYQHFGTIDGLLDAIAEEVVSELLDEVELTARGRVESGGVTPHRAFFDALAQHLAGNEALGRSYCEHVPPELLFDHLSRPLVRQSVERGLVGGDVPDEELEMALAFGLGGLFALYRWWALTDRELPVSEVMRHAGRMFEEGVTARLGRGAERPTDVTSSAAGRRRRVRD